jgi:Icc-related predicted phosphoesterase/uncharacterized protein YprB with RNaseH-like and TPR domain
MHERRPDCSQEGVDMRILAFSDWRSQSMESLFQIIERLDRPVDLILYAGDDVGRFETERRNIFAELAAETELGKVLAVIGNDDLPGAKRILSAEGVHNLHQEPFVHGEYAFLGQEGAVEGGPGLVLYSEADIQQQLEGQYGTVQDEIPVLVSHVPPNGVLDIARRFGQRHIGSTAVREFIRDAEVPLTVCGHCHQFGGRAAEEAFGTVINIASHDDERAKGKCAVIELDGADVDHQFTTTEEGADHDLFQLSQVGRRRIQDFLELGIDTLEDITESNRDRLEGLPGSSDWHADMWLKEAEAIQNGEILPRDPAEFEFLTENDVVLLDIETDLNQEHIWLVGLYSYSEAGYTQIFEKDDEKQLLESLIQYLASHDEPTVVYYGNNRFDEQCLKQRMDAHGLYDGIELLNRSHDLGIVIQNHLLGGFNRTNLSDFAKTLVDYEYSHPGIDGFVVGARYTRYLLDDEEPDWETLLEYNKDDVTSLKMVVDEIREVVRRQSQAG